MAVRWRDDRAAHLARHGVTIAQADEALADPDRVVINPDYASRSGVGIRTIGYSRWFGDVLTVITVPFEGATYGATAFPAERRDRLYYVEGG